MKLKTSSIGAIVGCAALGLVAVVASARTKVTEVKGTVSQILMNPEGDADGFLLQDGTQVHFPPHLSKDLQATVAANDAVTIQGVSEGSKRMRAETITNAKTNKVLKDTPPTVGRKEKAPPPPPAPGAGPGPRHESLTELSSEGKVTSQLYGPGGNVDGVILSSGAIVHVGPRLVDSSKVKMDVGSQLRASGFGTKNELGQSFEATKLENF